MANTSKAVAEQIDTDEPAVQSETGNLVQLEESTTLRKPSNELNQKISQIDTDLDELKSELRDTNKGIKSTLKHLADQDADLTGRVSETYRQLGQLDGAYRTLSEKSSKISKEVKEITKNLDQLAEKSSSDIGFLTEGYESLVTRTEELAKKSKLTTQSLNRSIRENAKAMAATAAQLTSEIESLARTSKERDDNLADRAERIGKGLNQAEGDIRSHQARLIKLQSVDQSLENRAEALEATTAELKNNTRELTRSATLLNQRTAKLADAIEALQAKTEAHSELIGDLQERATLTSQALAALSKLEKRHFWTLGGLLAALILAIGAYVVHQRANWETEAQANAALQNELSTVSSELGATDNRLADLDTRVAEIDAKVAQMDTEAAEIDAKVTQIDTQAAQLSERVQQMDDSVQNQLNRIGDDLVTIDDQMDSLDGRMNNLRPHRGFGSGNLIHGPQWLAQQPAEGYVILLTSVGDKQDLYKIAERYSNYLKGELAYLSLQYRGAQRFALISSGFSSEKQALAALGRIPPYLNQQRPSVQSMAKVQGLIAN